MILVIQNGCQLLFDGILRGADVSWISVHRGEEEFIILPITFHNFKPLEMTKRLENGWCIPEDYAMYITSDCKSGAYCYNRFYSNDNVKLPSSEPNKMGLTKIEEFFHSSFSSKSQVIDIVSLSKHKIFVERKRKFVEKWGWYGITDIHSFQKIIQHGFAQNEALCFSRRIDSV